MKKLLLLALTAVVIAGCYQQNKSGVEQNFKVVKTNGDTIRLRAMTWRWDGSHNVVFSSDNGSQYISDVKDILKEMKGK